MRGTQLSRGNYLSYALGSVGTAGFSTVPGLLLAYYLTNILGVAAGAAAFVVVLPKIWDVGFLPVVGNLSDRSVGRRGSRRPFLLLGGATLPVLFALMFAAPPSAGSVVGALWVFVFFLLAASAFAVFQVPYIAMPAEITDDPEERTTVMSWRVAFLGGGILLFGAGAPALKDAMGGGAGGYLVMGIVVGALIGLGMLGCWWGLRRTRILHRAEAEPSLRVQLLVARQNRPFVFLLSAFFLQALATGAMLAGAQYYATYVLGKESLITVLFVCLVGPAVLVMPLWAAVGHRMGKRAGFLAASLAFLAGTVLLAFSRSFPDGVVYLVVALCGVGYAGMQMFPLAMLPDTVAADTAVSGKRRAGIFTGLWTAGETTGFALGPALVLGVLAVTGFVSTTGDKTVAQPSSAVTGVLLSFSVVPAVLLLLSLPFLRRYELEAVEPTDRAEDEGERV
ncbi:MAG TPA: MFS transporter [Actinomycetes bacterium]